MQPLAEHASALFPEILQPIIHVPRHPRLLAQFAWRALAPATRLARKTFDHPAARALFSGMAAHSFLALDAPASAAVGLVLGMAAHSVGWPLARGGSQAIANALAGHLLRLGGKIETHRRISRLSELPPARAVLLDVTAWQFAQMAADRLSGRDLRKLISFRHAPGVFKIDYALSAPIPWTAPDCRRAGTVHLGGTLEEVAASESDVLRGAHPERPFVLLAQQSLFDQSRAPHGKHTVWAYCHVPWGSTLDMAPRIERQIERFAPGFRDTILHRHTMKCADLQAHNPSLVGGDISGGAGNLWQLLARPTLRSYRTSLPGVYLCSASTPPGGGVHGMCGYHAARVALREVFA